MTDKQMLEFMAHLRREGPLFKAAPRLSFASVQAGSAIDSDPAKDDCDWYYTVEVGFPSHQPPREMRCYRENARKHWSQDVYSNVPVEMVFKWIDSLGGWEKVKR